MISVRYGKKTVQQRKKFNEEKQNCTQYSPQTITQFTLLKNTLRKSKMN